MLNRWTKRQLWTWIAAFAILMNALVPAIGRTLAATSKVPSAWEICTVDPSKKMDAKLGMLEHCGYCTPHNGEGLLPELATPPSMPKGHELRPFLFYHAPQPLLIWATQPARGPPAVL